MQFLNLWDIKRKDSLRLCVLNSQQTHQKVTDLLQSIWGFHRRPAICRKFWFDLANVYKVLLPVVNKLTKNLAGLGITDQTLSIFHQKEARFLNTLDCFFNSPDITSMVSITLLQ